MKVKQIVVPLLIAGLVLVAFAVQKYLTEDTKSFQPTYLFSIRNAGNSKLKRPNFAIEDEKGRIFVSDSGNHRIAVFDEKGNFLYSFGDKGKTYQKVISPFGLGIVGSSLLVADPVVGNIIEYKSDGQFVKKWATKGKSKPVGIYVADDSTVYVTDLVSNQIIRYDKGGRIINAIELKEAKIGSPVGLDRDSKGNFWLADSSNYNIKSITQNGSLLNIFDGGPGAPLSMAKGLAIDHEDRIYVADTLAGVVRIFDTFGNDITWFGYSDQDGNKLDLPTGISINDDKIYVADEGINEVQVWSID